MRFIWFKSDMCYQFKAVQHERKPLVEKKEVTSTPSAVLHNTNDNVNSNNDRKASFGANNINSIGNILPAQIFANFTSNVAQQGKLKPSGIQSVWFSIIFIDKRLHCSVVKLISWAIERFFRWIDGKCGSCKWNGRQFHGQYVGTSAINVKFAKRITKR